MTQRGISSPIILVIVGVLIIIGAFVVPNFTNNVSKAPIADVDSTGGNLPDAVAPDDDAADDVAPVPSTPTKPKPPQVTPPSSPSVPPPVSSSEGGGASASEPPPAATTPPPSEPVSPPAPPPTVSYDPGFKATSRVTPEIPSENERATLPACNGAIFAGELVQLSKVQTINPTGIFGASTNPPSFTIFDFGTSGEYDLYDVFAPADVYVTNVVQEFGVTADSEDTTIYFALCKDVIGYVTNIKVLSSSTQKIITNSDCFGKPQTGENACKIEVLKLIAQGSSLGKAGKYGGEMGFGVIDLRTERNLPNPEQYPIKTNFAACPLDYLANPGGFYGKLSGENSLCKQP